MEAYILASLILIVLIFLVYTSVKTKKIYSENVEYEPKNEELIKKIERRLALKGYKFRDIRKFEYYYCLDKHKERILLPRIRIYKRKFRTYGLLINSQSESLKDNQIIKKEILEFLATRKLYGIIVYNEKNSNFELAKVRRRKPFVFLIIIVLIFLFYYYVLN